jgi:putative lipoic acid-binding regulatory protein|tara:strand:+ start:323 stop:514 length:192 start_codon:yes stop_codon:yes gene_type:complete
MTTSVMDIVNLVSKIKYCDLMIKRHEGEFTQIDLTIKAKNLEQLQIMAKMLRYANKIDQNDKK